MADRSNHEISTRNAEAIAENLTELRHHYEKRLTALENTVATLSTLVQNQSRVIGEALQRLMGSGPTERD